MNKITVIAIKDLRLLFRDKVGLFFIFAFPVCMGLLFGLVTPSGNSRTSGFSIAIVDEDESRMSKLFVESLSSRDGLKVVETDRKDAQDRVRRGNLVAMIVLPKGFGERAGVVWDEPPKVLLGIDPSRSAEGGMLEGFFMQSLGTMMFQRFQDPAEMQTMLADARSDVESQEDMPLLLKTLCWGCSIRSMPSSRRWRILKSRMETMTLRRMVNRTMPT